MAQDPWPKRVFGGGAVLCADSNLQAAYFQFQTCLRGAEDTGVYLAGDSVSWSGGWVEGALQTGLNAACAAAHRCDVDVIGGSPLSQNDSLYKYH